MWANLVNAYQRDLADFVNTVTTDTTRALTAITTGLPTSDDESDDGLPPDEVENDQESPVHGLTVTRPRPSASAKQEAQMMALEALEAKADTYMKVRGASLVIGGHSSWLTGRVALVLLYTRRTPPKPARCLRHGATSSRCKTAWSKWSR